MGGGVWLRAMSPPHSKRVARSGWPTRPGICEQMSRFVHPPSQAPTRPPLNSPVIPLIPLPLAWLCRRIPFPQHMQQAVFYSLALHKCGRTHNSREFPLLRRTEQANFWIPPHVKHPCLGNAVSGNTEHAKTVAFGSDSISRFQNFGSVDKEISGHGNERFPCGRALHANSYT